MDGQADRGVGRSMTEGGMMDGSIDGLMDRGMEGWTDRWTPSCLLILCFPFVIQEVFVFLSHLPWVLC